MAPRMALLAFLGTAGAMKCPGSSSWVHASAKVEVLAQATCQDVMEEIKARVAGNEAGTWHDPHNGGTYSLLKEDSLELDLQRVTGNHHFTDKLIFTFSDYKAIKPTCGIHACSESQIFSVKDFSTNYCNVRNLYCGKEDGCVPVKHDFDSSEVKLSPSAFAGTDKDACIVNAAPATMLRGEQLKTAATLLGDTVDDTLACINDNCPLDERTLSPSPTCVLGNCTSNLAKCLFSSTCRNGVMCELKCTEPLAKTEDAVHFAGLMECMRVKCPGFPPSKSCAALHCGVEAAECAVHSKCRHTLECADDCVPGKYTAALAAVNSPKETVV